MLENLASHQGISNITDDHIIKWANERVTESGRNSRMRNFKDSSLKNSIFLLELVSAIEPRAVNWDMVQHGASNEELMMNAKYVISNARKIGACVFLTPEDIVEVNSKMILTFVASIWQSELQRH